jgi:hypothetical protein
MAIRTNSGAFSGPLGLAFAAEILLGGVLPLSAGQPVASAAGRRAFVASLLTVVGVATTANVVPLRDVSGAGCLGRTGVLHAVDRRVGRFDQQSPPRSSCSGSARLMPVLSR